MCAYHKVNRVLLEGRNIVESKEVLVGLDIRNEPRERRIWTELERKLFELGEAAHVLEDRQVR